MHNNNISKNIAIIGKKKIQSAIYEAKQNLKETEYHKYINSLKSYPFIDNNIIFQEPKPRSIVKLGTIKQIPTTSDLTKELIWNMNSLLFFKKELISFFIKQNNFNRSVLLNEYEDANDTLNSIKREYGVSLWYLENKIYLLQEMNGLKANKDYVKEIQEKYNEDISAIVQMLLTFFSIRMEKNVSAEKYNSIVSDLFNNIKNGYNNQSSIINYFRYRLILKDIFGYDYLSIMYYDSNLSIVDRFISFLKIKQSKNYTGLSDVIKNDVSKSINELTCSAEKNSVDRFEYLKMFDLYLMGKYASVVQMCEKFLSIKPDLIEIYEVYVRSLMYLGIQPTTFQDQTTLFQILNCLENMYLAQSNYKDSRAILLKITYTLSNNLNILKLRKLILHIEKTYSLTNKGSYVFDSEILFPSFFDALCYDEGSKVENFTFAQLYNARENPNRVIIERKKLTRDLDMAYQADILIHQKEYFKAAESLKALIDITENRRNKIEALVKYVNCCMQINQLKDAANCLTHAYFDDNIFLYQLNLSEFLENYDSFQDINVPILYDIYAKHASKNLEIERSDSYEDLLSQYDVERPTKLISKNKDTYDDEWSRERFIYFLKNICVSNIMDNSLSFSSIKEIKQERISICKYLLENDQNNSAIYSEEITNLTQALFVDEKLQEIDKKKIYVDTLGIKDSLQPLVEENLNRYKSLIETNSATNAEYITVDDSMQDDNIHIQFVMPSDEKNTLFYAMFLEIRDNFVSSNEYGLDGYLSVGIRHGTLAGQIRATFAENNLITKKGEDGKYQLAPKLIEELPQNIQTEVATALNKFGLSADSLISMLKNDWIQIKTESSINDKGLFNFQFTPDEFDSVSSKITQQTDYDSFMDNCFDLLWEKTDASLYNIREKISGELKSNFNDIFEQLLLELSKFSDAIPEIKSLKRSALDSKTKLQYELDTITDWFQRNENIHDSPFTSNDLIEIVNKSLENIYSKPRLKIEKDLEDIKFSGKTLKSFVDILIILFDNMVKHSQVEDKVDSKITLHLEEEFITLTCTNKVNDNIVNKDSRDQMSQLTKKINRHENFENINQEGGTGFYKIKKIVSVDLKSKLEFNANFYNVNDFVVTLKFSSQFVLNKEDES